MVEEGRLGDCILNLSERDRGRSGCTGSGSCLDLPRRREMRSRHAKRIPRHLYFLVVVRKGSVVVVGNW